MVDKLAELVSAPGGSSDIVERVMDTARETLDMDVSFVSHFNDKQMVLRSVGGDAQSFGWSDGQEVPLEETYCNLVTSNKLPNIVRDARNDERVNNLEVTASADIGSYVGLPLELSDGRLYGTLCCLSHSADPSLQERDDNAWPQSLRDFKL